MACSVNSAASVRRAVIADAIHMRLDDAALEKTTP